MAKRTACSQCDASLGAKDKFCTSCGCQVSGVGEGASQSMSNGQAGCLGSGTRWWCCLALGLFALTLVLLQLVTVFELRQIRQYLYQDAPVSSAAPVEQPSPHDFASQQEWANPMGAMVFSALKDPCGQCELPILKNFCGQGKGQLALKELINSLFREGKGVKDIFGFFVKECGVEILTPEAQAIYKQNNP